MNDEGWIREIMFGLIRTRQNVAGFTASPGVSTSPGPAATGSPKGSPNAVVGEIDTRAPFQSVKAAVNLFGEASPKSGKPRLRFKTPDEVYSDLYICSLISITHILIFSYWFCLWDRGYWRRRHSYIGH